MNRRAFHRLFAGLATLALLALAPGHCLAEATITQQIDPQQTTVGQPVIVTITLQNASVSRVDLPTVDGLQVDGSSMQIQSIDDNGTLSTSVAYNFSVEPTRPGDFTIPAFDIRTMDNQLVHVRAMKLHVDGSGGPPSLSNSNTTSPNPGSSIPAPASNGNGPVVMPPNNPPGDQQPPGNSNGNEVSVPRDPDGSPARVFLKLTADTTNAYVGQAVPIRVDFYIRLDVRAQQDSLPTIKGSDFVLTGNMSERPQTIIGTFGGDQEYERTTWFTAVSCPKPGDFPLTIEQDTYWVKEIQNNNNGDPFSIFFSRQASLAHDNIDSNSLTVHVQPLPDAGRPDHFGGAIGQFKVTGNADPLTVAVGEPVTIHYVISGTGNFDYVHSPTLADDPAWKVYTPVAKANYFDDTHTNATKTYDQPVIPQTNGSLALPAATFSYFDPTTKQYVNVPIPLPTITVTGTPLANTSASGATSAIATAAANPAIDTTFRGNKLDLGSPQLSMISPFRRVWYWATQGGLAVLLAVGLILLIVRRSAVLDNTRAERAQRRRSLQQEQDAMSLAVQQNDAVAFFIAARHAVQIQLGARWNIHPEALTLSQIRERDSALAEVLEPLFTQADQVIYSGMASPGLDLAQWEQSVRNELLQLQPA